MKEKEKRVYLNRDQQKEIVRDFFEIWKGKEFGRSDLKAFLIENYEWYRNSTTSIQNARLEAFITVIKDMYGKKLERVIGGQPGEKTTWLLPTVATEIAEEKPKLKRTEKKHHHNVERLKKFYNIVKMASRPIGGILIKDLSSIMGYKNVNISEENIKSLNNLFELETGYRPLTIDKQYRFCNLSVVVVEKDLAELIMTDLLDKLSSNEPAESVCCEYDIIVKHVMRNDYNILKMFEDKTTLMYKGGDAARFKSMISSSTGTEKVVYSYLEQLKLRYGFELTVDIRPYNYIKLVSSQEDWRAALIKIEDLYAEFFCEDIVPHERTVLAEEIKKEILPDQVEQNLGDCLEVFFKKKKKLFISELWEILEKHHFLKLWDIISVFKKFPEKFRITSEENKGKGGLTETCITYIASEQKPAEEYEKEIVSLKEELSSLKREKESSLEISVLFEEKIDIDIFCNILSYEYIGTTHHGSHFVKIKVDKTDKKAVYTLLKLYYVGLRNSRIEILNLDSKTVEELEKTILA